MVALSAAGVEPCLPKLLVPHGARPSGRFSMKVRRLLRTAPARLSQRRGAGAEHLDVNALELVRSYQRRPIARPEPKRSSGTYGSYLLGAQRKQ